MRWAAKPAMRAVANRGMSAGRPPTNESAPSPRSTLGRRVEWDVAGVTRHGVAEDIDETGALVVRDGTARARVISGEVRWLP